MQKVSTRKVFSTLRDIQKDVEKEIYDLNNGGCAVFAYLVGERLRKLGLSVEVITPIGEQFGEDKFPAKIVRKRVNDKGNVREWDENGLSRKHLALRIKTDAGNIYTYDSDCLIHSKSEFGIYGDESDSTFGTGLSVAECKNMAQEVDYWNSWFCRKQIPRLKLIIKKNFKKLDSIKKIG